jgi:hypothetical protein
MTGQPIPSGHQSPVAESVPPEAVNRGWLSWGRIEKALVVLTPILTAIFGSVLGIVQWHHGQELQEQQWRFDQKLKEQQSQIAQQQIQISQQQANTAQRVSHSDMIAKMRSELSEMLKDVPVPQQYKSIINISLMKITTESRLSEAGENDEVQKQLIRQIPLYYALLLKDYAALAAIGSTPEDIDLWIKLASASGDRSIKVTAINALEEIILASSSSSDAIKLQKKVAKLYLEPRFHIDDRNVRTALIQGIDSAMVKLGWSNREPARCDGDQSRHPPGSLFSPRPSEDPDSPADKSPQGAGGRSETNQIGLDAEIRELICDLHGLKTTLLLNVASEQKPGVVSSASPDGGIPERVIRPDADAVLRGQKAESLIEPVSSLRPTSEDMKKHVKMLIEKFESGQADEQQRSVSALARIGADAAPMLIEAINAPESTYRTHYSAIGALALMSSPVEIPNDGTRSVVNLLRYSDIAVRNIAATFLSNVVGSATRERAMNLIVNELLQISSSSDQDFVTMAARVFGSWLAEEDLDKTFEETLRRDLVSVRDKLASKGGYGAAVNHFNYLIKHQT